MVGKKVKCAKCGQRILVPTPPPQTKAGTNKTTLGKIIDGEQASPASSPPVQEEIIVVIPVRTADGELVSDLPAALPAPIPPPLPTDSRDRRHYVFEHIML
jgi:hypothetical protein